MPLFIESNYLESMFRNSNVNERYSYQIFFILLIFLIACNRQQAQEKQHQTTTSSKLIEVQEQISNAPSFITRNIIQDRQRNMWFATFDGIFKYDGKSFSNVSNSFSKSRFFSVMEDRNGHLWFGSIGEGIYKYDGNTFQNFTSNDGLINNEIGWIFEDSKGHFWFGANGAISKSDGNSFVNYRLMPNGIIEDTSGVIIPNMTRPSNEVNAIVEDNKGFIWIGTRGRAFTFDGKIFKPIMHEGNTFNNVRTILKDQQGHIWLGGNNGLWKYDGASFIQLSENFTGNIFEDSL
ncbi:MAG: two-component regulator propeller domain-containing protein, partial [Bacteroidota bacterium]